MAGAQPRRVLFLTVAIPGDVYRSQEPVELGAECLIPEGLEIASPHGRLGVAAIST